MEWQQVAERVPGQPHERRRRIAQVASRQTGASRVIARFFSRATPVLGAAEGRSSPWALESRGRRCLWGWLALSWVLVAVPVLTVERYPPILDLPQLFEQVRLFEEVVAGSRPDLELNLWSPNKLAYAVLFPAWWLGGPALAPRLTAWALAALVLAGCAWMIRRLELPGERLLWCVPWIWNVAYQVGLAHFLLGIVPALFWLGELVRQPRGEETKFQLALRGLGFGFLLYLSHALWLLWAGAIWAVVGWARRTAWQQHLARGVGFGLPFVLASLWYLGLEERGWQQQTYWYLSLPRRWWNAESVAAHFLGVQRGGFEPAILLVMIGFFLWGWVSNRKRAVRVDDPVVAAQLLLRRVLLGVGFVLVLVALLGPEAYGDTALFGRRWGWVAGLLLLFSTPEPAGSAWMKRLLAGCLAAIATASAALAWLQADAVAFRPLKRLLDQIESGERVFGVDWFGPPPPFWVPVNRHAVVYAAVERGAETNFSFAEFPTSLVTYRDPPVQRGWRHRAQEGPKVLTRPDLDSFDWVLRSGRPEDQLQFGRAFQLQPVAQDGIWTLWKGLRKEINSPTDQFPVRAPGP